VFAVFAAIVTVLVIAGLVGERARSARKPVDAANAHLTAARSRLADKQFDAARQEVQLLISVDPTNAAAAALLDDIQREQDRWTADKRHYLAEAEAALGRKDLETAKANVKHVLDFDPDNSDGRILLRRIEDSANVVSAPPPPPAPPSGEARSKRGAAPVSPPVAPPNRDQDLLTELRAIDAFAPGEALDHVEALDPKYPGNPTLRYRIQQEGKRTQDAVDQALRDGTGREKNDLAGARDQYVAADRLLGALRRHPDSIPPEQYQRLAAEVNKVWSAWKTEGDRLWRDGHQSFAQSIFDKARGQLEKALIYLREGDENRARAQKDLDEMKAFKKAPGAMSPLAMTLPAAGTRCDRSAGCRA
jgi:Tfp pilus assembly protein PilF